jgi:Na+/melibiose symporter-like transporter
MVIQQYLLLVLYAIPSGIGIGGLITLPFSMIADTVDEEELRTGHRSEGLYYGGLTFSYKISQSIAIFLLGIILDMVGFDSDLATQPIPTVVSLGLIVAVGTLIALVASMLFYKRYDLTKDKAEEIKKAIEKKLSIEVATESLNS